MTHVLEGNTQSKEKLVIRVAIGRARSGRALFQVCLSNMKSVYSQFPRRLKSPNADWEFISACTVALAYSPNKISFVN